MGKSKCLGEASEVRRDVNVELLKGEERDSREMIDDLLIVVKNVSCAFSNQSVDIWDWKKDAVTP